MISAARRLARVLSDLLEGNPLWHAAGRRWFLPRLELLPPGEDHEECWRHVYGDFATRQNLEQTLEQIWLCRTRSRARGGLILSSIEGGLLLHTMRVLRPYRGLGVGSWLLRRVLKATDAEGMPIWLQVRPDNRPALRLYRSLGFRPTSPPPRLRREGHLVLHRSPPATSRF